MNTELQTIPTQNRAIDVPLRAVDVRAQVNLIQEVMRDVMQGPTQANPAGVHYGLVPGCGDKPTLLQPGAHKLIMTFRLVPDPEMTVIMMEKGHREVRCKVKLYSQSGGLLGAGIGTCSTMEGKYRYRTGPVEFTDKMVPREYWDLRDKDPNKAKALLGEGMVAKKNEEGRWMCARQGGKVEHDNPADYYNTVEKMAYKRALVSATLTVTAASDIFTQDIEDMPEVLSGAAVPPVVVQAPPSPSQAPPIQPGQGKAADVLGKMQRPAPAPTIAEPTHPSVVETDPNAPSKASNQPIEQELWDEILDYIANDPILTQLKNTWQTEKKIKNLHTMLLAGQRALLTVMRTQPGFPY